MQFAAQVKLFGIESQNAEVDGQRYQSTSFHLPLDIKESSTKRTMGTVTRPFKLGDHTEYDKWAHLEANLGDGKFILCDAVFNFVAVKVNGKESAEPQLVSIKPASQQPKAT